MEKLVRIIDQLSLTSRAYTAQDGATRYENQIYITRLV